MRRQQLLAQLLENGRNSRWLSISLGLGLHARSRLVEYQWSWERWGISLELHGRTWSMTWRALEPQSQRLPLVTHYTVMDSNPAARTRSPCSSQHMSRPVWRLPKTIWMIQRRHGRRSCGQMRPKYNFLLLNPLAVFGGRRRISTIPRTPSQPWNIGVEWSCFGVLFCKGDRTTAPYWGEDGWGQVSWDFGQQPPSLSKSIEDGLWLGLPAGQWPQTHSTGN